ncbi:MAG: 8-oxo-dGTP diphosphatase [Candidatus Doudnabacteria bacterium]|nr:8-oxo-dGTP diphosphatase [Candidatus Doudnabacteria bacterium]
MTLCLVRANSQILLGFKKRGFGAGRWNGFGGKLKPGEDLLTACRRELLEESGLTAIECEKKAIMHFRFMDDTDEIEVHLFEVKEFTGEPVETEEMRPQWFYKNEIPFDKMWPDDRFWFPYFLEGKNFEGQFFFRDQNKLVDCKITEVANVL